MVWKKKKENIILLTLGSQVWNAVMDAMQYIRISPWFSSGRWGNFFVINNASGYLKDNPVHPILRKCTIFHWECPRPSKLSLCVVEKHIFEPHKNFHSTADFIYFVFESLQHMYIYVFLHKGLSLVNNYELYQQIYRVARRGMKYDKKIL